MIFAYQLIATLVQFRCIVASLARSWFKIASQRWVEILPVFIYYNSGRMTLAKRYRRCLRVQYTKLSVGDVALCLPLARHVTCDCLLYPVFWSILLLLLYEGPMHTTRTWRRTRQGFHLELLLSRTVNHRGS